MLILILCLIATVMIPAFAMVLCAARMKNAKAVVLGSICFLVSQMLLRIPLLQYILPRSARYIVFQYERPMAYLLLLALSAGIFEECGRWMFIRAGKLKGIKCGAAFGIGHGATESVLVVGLPLLGTVVLKGMDIRMMTVDYLAGAVERLFAIVGHVGLSILVVSAVERKRACPLLAAITIHTVLDFGAAYAVRAGVGIWQMEILGAAYAVGVLLLAIYVYVKRKGG